LSFNTRFCLFRKNIFKKKRTNKDIFIFFNYFSDKNKEHILEESGLYALMKSLNDIESGDDELFKAIKYLIQLCTSEFNEIFLII